MDQSAFDIRLSPGADRLLDAVASGKFADREGYLLRFQAERLMLVSGFDELACRDSLDFSPFNYQVKAAQTALRRFRGRGGGCRRCRRGRRGHTLRWNIVHTARGQQNDQACHTRKLFE